MDNKDFHELALRVLANDASATESALFQSMVAKDPARSQEFKEIKQTMALLRNAVPAAQALEAKGPELPAYRMNELRDAVRKEFRKKNTATSGANPQPWFSLKWILASGFASAAMLFLVIFATMGQREIEVGMYEGYVLRGGTPLVLPTLPRVHHHAFKKDDDFDKWKQESLAWNQKAKVWVDEETDLIHIERRDGWSGMKETTEKLAPKKADQQKQFDRILESLQ